MLTGVALEEGNFTMTESSAAVESSEFLVRSRTEVVRLLNEIKASGTLIAVSFPQVDCAAATTLVYVDEVSNMLLLEYPREWRDMMDSGGDSIMLACVYDNAKIQFQAGKGTVVDLDGVPVVGLEIPEFMWRFQRRASPRDKVTGLTITLNLGFSECDAEVTDLSMGGVGMFNCDSEVRLEPGEELRDCAIAIPGMGRIPVDLTVQHQAPVPGDGNITRVGCQFTGLNDSARQLIAHYLDALADI
jgi:c-di-GMP-binding flagellar brake protein YcgR